MGILVSTSGFSSVALAQASGRRTPLLLMDHQHMYLSLSGGVSFREIVNRVRRHESQTRRGVSSPDAFGG